jgi:hypothetical protein
MAPIYLLFAVTLLLIAVLWVSFRLKPKKVDWALEVAFIRLEFPPEQRVLAQRLAAGLAEIVGLKIKRLKPEHNLTEIASWAEDEIYARDLIRLFVVTFGVECDPATTFRDLVEKVARKEVGETHWRTSV